MKRRAVLGTFGVLGSVPVVGYATRNRDPTISVRFWRTPRADEYDGIEPRVHELLTRSLEQSHWSVSVSSGGVVDVGTERAAEAVTGGRWPSVLLGGATGLASPEPVWDVNLLVTDGRLDEAPTGYGVPHVAAVGGARWLANLDPIKSVDEPAAYTDETFAAQVLLHEVGHALGLSHADGHLVTDGSTEIATPMLSAYAWDPDFDWSGHGCGYRPDFGSDGETPTKRLSFTYSDCARRKLRERRRTYLG